MLLFVTCVHFIVAVLLIVFVLIQDSKGGGVFGMGASGGSNQVFSATGAANFMVRATRGLAILFAVTCITLTWLTTKKSGSVTDDFVPAATPLEQPVNPAAGTTAPADATAPAAAPQTPPAETPATGN